MQYCYEYRHIWERDVKLRQLLGLSDEV